jgi:hypothetical protein
MVKVARAGMDAPAAAVDGVLAGHESPKLISRTPSGTSSRKRSHWAFGFVRSWWFGKEYP